MSPYGDFLGIQIGELAAGRAVCSMTLMDHHLNNGGRVHGGVLTSLADTAAGAAVRTLRPAGKASATTDLNVAFIRPPLGDRDVPHLDAAPAQSAVRVRHTADAVPASVYKCNDGN